ncbi:unnamed protein product [Rotaria sordida]|uniref:Beta-microseminoprotein n=1 Tax=Rotaria sordida TaxID=392033 RepID=A0A819D096_9BILA|nr:unnamed protein product [Rotaria sordida]CAF3825103.1 unnamed protein product [Rotaria sordida]CAF3838365.1 unnamed protein product [Rotaria sordida]
MAFYISTVILLLISIFTSHVYSYCIQGPLTSQRTKFGNVNQFCEYNKIKVLPGSSFKLATPDCIECKCSTQGLQCCGFGFSAGVVEAPEGCEAYNDACNLVFVKKDNPSELCFPPKSPNKPKKNMKDVKNKKIAN